MATFYFNAAVDYDWQNLGNWWMNDTFTTPATSLPTSTDDVIAVARISTNSGSEPTVKNFTMNGDYTVELGISITVTGTATFNNIGGFFGVTVTGNCIVNDGSFLGGNVIGDCVLNNAGTSFSSTITGNIICNGNSGIAVTINGNGTFNDTSSFNGVITGDCIFNDFADFLNYFGFGPFPSITGNCTFNDNSNASSNGLITGNCTFNDNSISFGVNISGNATFNNNANVQEGSSLFPTVVTNGICTFNDSSANKAIVTGDCVFNNSSLNTGTVTEDATFNNYSMNTGSISGTATFTGQAANGGTAGTFVPASPPQILFFNAAVDNNWNNLNNWWTDVSCTIPATNLPTNANSVIATSSILTNSGSNPTIVNLRMLASRLNINITTTGLCLFITDGKNYLGQWPSVTAYNSGTVTGNCLFVHNTYNTGTINGNATFYDDSFNVGTVSGNIISDGFNFYFNAAVDNDWQTLGNWWMNSGYTIPATSLPTSNDNVIAVASISTNSGSEPTVTNFILNDPAGTSPYLGIDITVTGLCIFNSTANYGNITGDCIFNNASSASFTITGNCTFNGTSTNYGAITGNCIFNDTSTNLAGQFNPVFAVTGDCTFNDGSQNSGNITANCTFNDASQNYNPITGNCTFNNSSHNNGTITGDCTFNDSSYNQGTINGQAIFTKSSYIDPVIYDLVGTASGVFFNSPSSVSFIMNSGVWDYNNYSPSSYYYYQPLTFAASGQNWTFNNYSSNNGYISGLVTFNDFAVNNSGIIGDCSFNNYSTNRGGPFYEISISGNCTFNDYSSTSGNIVGDCIFNDNSLSNWHSNNYYWIIANSSSPFLPYVPNILGNCTFNSYSVNKGSISGVVTFNNNSSNSINTNFWEPSGIIIGEATFYESSNNLGIINGDATFKDSSYTVSSGIVFGNEIYIDRTTYPIQRGINGSNILGIV